METIELAHVLGQQEVASVIFQFAAASKTPFAVKDESLTLLLGSESDDQSESYPVEIHGAVIGWVSGNKEASLLASFISYAAKFEYEKRLLKQAGAHHDLVLAMEQLQQYRLILEQVSDVVCYLDRDFKIQFVSASVTDHLGYLPEELTGKSFVELGLLTEESLHRAISNTVSIFKGVPVPAAEYEFIAKNGARLIAEIRSTPIYKNGDAVSIVCVARDITAQRKAEQALSASELRFRSMAENINSGLMIMEAGKMVYINDYACRLCGYSREEMLTIWGPDLTAPQSADQRDRILKTIHETGCYPEQADIWITRKDGTTACLNLRFSFDYSDARKQTGYVIINDITERRLIEDRIHATKTFLDNIIDNSIDAIVMADQNGRFKRINKAFLTLTGYAEEEVLGKHIAEFSAVMGEEYVLTTGEHVTIDQEYMDYTLRMAEKMLDEKKIAHWESYLVRKDGIAVPVETNITYFFNEEGIDTAVGIIRDITERKKAEEELIANKDFINNIIESSLDPIVIGNNMGRITRINRAFQKMTGFSQKDLQGRHLAELVPPRAGLYESQDGMAYMVEDSFYDRSYQAMVTLIEKGYISGHESYCYGKNGKIIPVEQTMFYSHDKRGNRQAVIAINRDIGDRKRAEKKLLDYQNQLRCLASQLTLSEEQERRRIATEIHDCIAQSLALAKIKLGALEQSLHAEEKVEEMVSIRSLLEQCIKDTRSLILELSPPFLYEIGLEKALEWLLEDIERRHGVKTHLECNQTQGGYDDDVRILLYQSIRELLINVVKHANARTATVSLDRDARKVHVCVEDDGRGFVVDPNGFQVSDSGGYGIFSIRERFQHLGGALTVDSRLNHGTRIFLDLPLV